MLNSSIAAVAKFRQELINEAFSLEDTGLAKQINNASEEDLLTMLLEYIDFKHAAEHTVFRIQEQELPF